MSYEFKIKNLLLKKIVSNLYSIIVQVIFIGKIFIQNICFEMELNNLNSARGFRYAEAAMKAYGFDDEMHDEKYSKLTY